MEVEGLIGNMNYMVTLKESIHQLRIYSDTERYKGHYRIVLVRLHIAPTVTDVGEI